MKMYLFLNKASLHRDTLGRGSIAPLDGGE